MAAWDDWVMEQRTKARSQGLIFDRDTCEMRPRKSRKRKVIEPSTVKLLKRIYLEVESESLKTDVVKVLKQLMGDEGFNDWVESLAEEK